MEVRRRLRLAAIEQWVEAVVVSTNASVTPKRIVRRNVTVLSGDGMVAFIRERRRAMSDEQVVRAVAAILRGDELVTVRAISST
jgi:hypothetical protein